MRPGRRRWSERNGQWAATLLLLALPWFGGCSSSKIAFNYPDEVIEFPPGGFTTPDIYISVITDLRPTEQMTGKGHFVTVTYPSDESWAEPVSSIYREALIQDLNQTHLVSLVPMPAQADFQLEADILSFSCRLQKSPVSFLLPIGVGMGLGLALGDDTSDKLKVGIVAGLVGLLVAPLPAQQQATAEVRIRLRDPAGDVVWEKICEGEVQERVNITSTARKDQKYVDQFLTKALKRCNACLIGQLRQEVLLSDG